jgi:hypothetical protein
MPRTRPTSLHKKGGRRFIVRTKKRPLDERPRAQKKKKRSFPVERSTDLSSSPFRLPSPPVLARDTALSFFFSMGAPEKKKKDLRGQSNEEKKMDIILKGRMRERERACRASTPSARKERDKEK